ncbi:unnamed protein product [Mycena citricolor]|uniref:RNA-dependent RNA polymerase n=1 Tax=Mycena citricolor TaxID=2018698 RepID=A0AAD2HQ57_9AGAR|nr:unnamed protein product [Mycena citricolor]
MVLTLRHFILKQEVFNLYRHAIRSSRGSLSFLLFFYHNLNILKAIPDPATRKETIQWIRADFERNRHLTDVALIQDKIKMGRRELKQMLPAFSILGADVLQTHVFSVEWQADLAASGVLSVNQERREFRLTFTVTHPYELTYHVAIPFSRINSILAHSQQGSILFFDLADPPNFESSSNISSKRTRLSLLPIGDHERLAPYISLALRIACRNAKASGLFRQLARTAASKRQDVLQLVHTKIQNLPDRSSEFVGCAGAVILPHIVALVRASSCFGLSPSLLRYVTVSDNVRIESSVRSLLGFTNRSFDFLDEGGMQYRFDREVDCVAFTRLRVGAFLIDRELTIAGRDFDFLAYSQSGSRSMLFGQFILVCAPIQDTNQKLINAAHIINTIGTFDPELTHCPARYAARISQAFTATDSTSLKVDEVIYLYDMSVPSGKYHFTDGVGTMSLGLAQSIWAELRPTRRRNRRLVNNALRAVQIRFQGSKGMFSVDYKLKGHVFCLRPSMIKFSAPHSTTIEIAMTFDKPGPNYLNRPLIMILGGSWYLDRSVVTYFLSSEGLGVDCEIFKACISTDFCNTMSRILWQTFQDQSSHPDTSSGHIMARPSTSADIGEFVIEYINSDAVGIVATNWLLIVDQSPHHIFDRDCLKLAKLHSDADEYPKSGQRVAVETIPKPKSRSKTDWHAPELHANMGYQRAIGKLFRAIDLGEIQADSLSPADSVSPAERRRLRAGARPRRDIQVLTSALEQTRIEDPILHALRPIVKRHTRVGTDKGHRIFRDIAQIFSRYTSELQSICVLAHGIARASCPPLRGEGGYLTGPSIQNLISTPRERTDMLVQGVKEEQLEDDAVGWAEVLRRGWLSLELAVTERNAFGAQSFIWIALAVILKQ